MLRARTPPGVAQEIYALLITYQALRIAISDAVLTRPDVDPDRGSFTIALNAARDQLIAAMGVLTDTTPTAVVDLVGVLGRSVLDHLLPERRSRTNPRVVKRAISVYAASAPPQPQEVFDRLQPYATGGQYVNFPGLYEDNDAMVRGAFGQNLGRLTAIKNRYDPTNLFRLNHNIALGQ